MHEEAPKKREKVDSEKERGREGERERGREGERGDRDRVGPLSQGVYFRGKNVLRRVSGFRFRVEGSRFHRKCASDLERLLSHSLYFCRMGDEVPTIRNDKLVVGQ